MDPARRNPDTESLLTRMLVPRIRDGEGTTADEMGGQAAVGMGWVMLISTLAEGEGLEGV
jgi:hypothetical protein